jgi:hypothetical protein
VLPDKATIRSPSWHEMFWKFSAYIGSRDHWCICGSFFMSIPESQ